MLDRFKKRSKSTLFAEQAISEIAQIVEPLQRMSASLRRLSEMPLPPADEAVLARTLEGLAAELRQRREGEAGAFADALRLLDEFEKQMRRASQTLERVN